MTGRANACFFIDPTSASITLAKLQNPVKAAFNATNDNLKETHSALNKYGRALDKVSGPDKRGDHSP